MLRIWILEPGHGYMEVLNGPYPIALEKFIEARKATQDALAQGGETLGRCPQGELARPILKRVVPDLKDFDALSVGFALTAARVRVQEENGKIVMFGGSSGR